MRAAIREIFEDGFWSGVRYLLFYSWVYPRLQRLAHRFNVHHMKVSHVPDGKLTWCHWCGVRHFEPNCFGEASMNTQTTQQNASASQTIQ